MAVRILVIDDDPEWIDFAREELGTRFSVEMATNVETALARLKQDRFDLIIVSSQRQDILEIIRKSYPEKRIVVATGQPTTREAIRMYRLGVFDYFSKDFRTDVVTEKISEAIQKPIYVPA